MWRHIKQIVQVIYSRLPGWFPTSFDFIEKIMLSRKLTQVDFVLSSVVLSKQQAMRHYKNGCTIPIITNVVIAKVLIGSRSLCDVHEI